MKHFHHKHHGFTLIEALIGLVVLAIGLLSLAKFHTSLISSSGLSKARTEAISLAQQEIEQQRNIITTTQYESLTTATPAPRTEDGTNAQFSIATALTPNTDPNSVDIDVTVSWTDKTGSTQSVALASIITWENPSGSALLATEGAPQPSSVQKPQGGADLGVGKTYTNDELAAKSPTPSGNDDGIVTIVNDAGKTELIDTNKGNEVVLTLNSLGAQFSTISGNIYFDSTSTAAITFNAANGVITSDGYALAPDAAYCTRTAFLQGDGVTYALNHYGDYRYFAYHCYIATDWYGNIGILHLDATNDSVCLGDPSVAGDALITPVRMYRGFYKKVSSTPGANPITYETYPSTSQVIYYSDGIAGGIQLTNHHWFIADIGNHPTDTDCIAPMTKVMTVGTTTYNGADLFADLPNDYFCLRPEDDPIYGPSPSPTPTNHQEMTAADETDGAGTSGNKIYERECNPVKPGNRVSTATLAGKLYTYGTLNDILQLSIRANSMQCDVGSTLQATDGTAPYFTYSCTVLFAEGTTWYGDIWVDFTYTVDVGGVTTTYTIDTIEACDGTTSASFTGIADGTTTTHNFNLCKIADVYDPANSIDDTHTASGTIDVTPSIGTDITGTAITPSPNAVTPCTVDPTNRTYTCKVRDYGVMTTNPFSPGTGWSGDLTIDISGAPTPLEVCGDNPIALSGINSSPYTIGGNFSIATTGNCPTPTISGTVAIAGGTPAPKTTSLTGVYLVTTTTNGKTISCDHDSSSPYTSGTTSTFSCAVQLGFSGTITLGNIDSRDTVNTLTFSNVNADTGSQTLTISP